MKSVSAQFHSNLPNKDVLGLMAECDVFAFPSFDESLGWVAIEAAGLGVPTVASNAFAIPELVHDGVTGFTVPLPLDADRRWRGILALNPGERLSYQDGIAKLKDGCERALARLLTSDTLRERMGKAARSLFDKRFAPEVAAARLAGMLRERLA